MLVGWQDYVCGKKELQLCWGEYRGTYQNNEPNEKLRIINIINVD